MHPAGSLSFAPPFCFANDIDMESTNWRSVAEITGVGAIVASLVFVGLQLKQSQDIAIAAQYHDRADVHMSLVLAHLEADYVIPSLRDRQSDGISAGDINTFHWLWVSLDNHYYQYQSGFLSEEGWLALQARLSEMLNTDPISRHLVVFRGSTFRQSFVELSRSLIEEPDSTPTQTRIDSVVEGTKSLEGAACKNGHIMSCLRVAGLTCERSGDLRSRMVCSSDERPVYSINNDIFDTLPYELPDEWAIEVLND